MSGADPARKGQAEQGRTRLLFAGCVAQEEETTAYQKSFQACPIGPPSI